MLSKLQNFFFAILLGTPLLLSATELEIRKITPPNLQEMHLGKKILCHRPMREGSPKMVIEQKNGQVIAHNYGHGGSGWTLGPGSAQYVNDLLISKYRPNSKFTFGLQEYTPITIIGAGALGLFTAYDLQKKGFNNLTIIAEQFDNLTSHNAGGFLAVSSMGDNTEMQKTIEELGIISYKFYESISKQTHPDFNKGAIILPTYLAPNDSRLIPYVGKVMQPPKNVILDFGNGTTRPMVAYDDGMFIDTAQMMINLTEYLKNKGVKFIRKKVKSFSEIKSRFIINCSGLGASLLNSDQEMLSVQGHLIMLKDQNPKELQYMISLHLNEDVTEIGQKVDRSFYIFPKHLANTGINDVGVIGGTFIKGATSKTPNTKEFDILLQGAKNFYGIK